MIGIENGPRKSRSTWVAALSVVGALVLVIPTLIASEPKAEPKTVAADAINWSSVDAGGGETSGGDWKMISTIGQHDAGALSGSTINVDGGFVLSLGPTETPLFSDGFESGHLGAWSSAMP